MKILRKDETVIGEYESIAAAVKQGVNLNWADLRRAYLSGANLIGAELIGADLRRAYLSGANLIGADLSESDLCGANLRGANLCRANLRGANLCGANLRGANLCGANLCGADLSDAVWNNATLSGALGAPWHFGLGRHIAIIQGGRISIGCKTETIEWWLANYERVGSAEGYSDPEITEYGAWLHFVADRLALRGTEKFSG